MKYVIAIASICAATSSLASPVTLEFESDFEPLPYSEKGIEVAGDGGVIDFGLAAEFFDETKSISFSPVAGLFSLLSFEIDRRISIANQFSLEGFLNGMRVWETGSYDFSDQEGAGALDITGFDTPFFDEFRIVGFGPEILDDSLDNIVFFNDITFDLDRNAVAPVPLPAGLLLLGSALLGLRFSKRFG